MELKSKNHALIINRQGIGVHRHNGWCFMEWLVIIMFTKPKFKITDKWSYFGWLWIYRAGEQS